MIELEPSLVENLDNPEGLKEALQDAIKLEHSTIPPYLYAYYSLGSSNAKISELLHSVVIDEMVHLALACNILNALGGEPVIDKPGFIPAYPGPLPGSVEKGLVVPLERFSPELVYNVFMEIEEPEFPLEFPSLEAEAPRLTIGMFYAAIRESLKGATFDGPRQRQLSPKSMTGVIEVFDEQTAVEAIDLIVEQGEGTSQSPLAGIESELAHYYRFAEIYHGRELVPNPEAGPETPPDERYKYDGLDIGFKPDGVRAVVKNPSTASYPEGSKARLECEKFNYIYTQLLNALHTTFNGKPSELRAAVGLMFKCTGQAGTLMENELPSGEFAGPSFEFQPDEPKA
jgi:rubrerythrin